MCSKSLRINDLVCQSLAFEGDSNDSDKKSMLKAGKNFGQNGRVWRPNGLYASETNLGFGRL